MQAKAACHYSETGTMNARVTTTKAKLVLVQQDRAVFTNQADTIKHDDEVGVSDAHMKIHVTGGNLVSVQMTDDGSWDRCEKAVGHRHGVDSKMVTQYARECPGGLKVEEIPGTKFAKVTMTSFRELFELEQTTLTGQLHIKVVSKFARKEKRKNGVHYTLRFEFDDGGVVIAPFFAKRASLMQHQAPRRELKRALDQYLRLNPSDEDMDAVKRFMVERTQSICAVEQQ